MLLTNWVSSCLHGCSPAAEVGGPKSDPAYRSLSPNDFVLLQKMLCFAGSVVKWILRRYTWCVSCRVCVHLTFCFISQQRTINRVIHFSDFVANRYIFHFPIFMDTLRMAHRHWPNSSTQTKPTTKEASLALAAARRALHPRKDLTDQTTAITGNAARMYKYVCYTTPRAEVKLMSVQNDEANRATSVSRITYPVHKLC